MYTVCARSVRAGQVGYACTVERRLPVILIPLIWVDYRSSNERRLGHGSECSTKSEMAWLGKNESGRRTRRVNSGSDWECI